MLTAVMGAGAASRFGADKLNTICAGRPLGQWALAAAGTLGHPVVWIGTGARPEFLPAECAFHNNRIASLGLGTSLALAARVARARREPALLVTLADMPLISGATLRRLIDSGPLAACSYGDRPGVPALFPAPLFGQLEALDGDRGASAILRAAPNLAPLRVDPEELLDVDTPADLAAAQAILAQRRSAEV